MPLAGGPGNGIVLMVLIYGTASISGGHLNPAVTFGLTVTQQITPVKMIIYWLAQICGGICGAAWVYALNNGTDQIIFGTTADGGAGSSADCTATTWKFGDDQNIAIKGCNSCTIPTWDGAAYGEGRFLVSGKVFGVEFLATFLLVFTVFATAVDPRGAAGNAAPFAIGGSLWASAKGIAGLTGAALNPARTLCPAIVFKCWRAIGSTEAASLYTLGQNSNGYDTRQWMYVIAQLTAGAFAGLLYMNVFLARPDDGNPGPSTVFKFVARDGVKVRAAMRAESEPIVITEEVTIGDEEVTVTESAIHV
jgi:glycerol uptake facilitator-like aquaporin